MNDQDPKNTNIEIRKVYLADLNTLIRIYQMKNQRSATQALTAHFGLPLSVAICNKEVLGFAAAALNASDELTVVAHCIKEDHEMGSLLKLQAKKTLEETFTSIKQDHTPFKNAVQHLLSWLNTCSN
ncbi:hypothetical protein [Pedobacter gandavensis]|uniref:N-acetyltransferase domain-containing protein n=1 Tax=Pedobacter gandavensis TaxID=2679963 RepID=A0ABR6ES04_9SPHI|nr:hypothetical protein [Pedobacter gandavensis]MBB2147599.1 hypothetical protein [Pedobacter gandavensis]